MNSVFFGTSDFAVPSLRRVAAETNIVAVVTQPDRPAGRGQRLMATPIKIAALGLGLPVLEPVRLGVLAPELRSLQPDILVVASYGRILPPAILDLPLSRVAFNVHPSLLPLYRGATPLQSAIRDGRAQTGITIIAMDAGMDTGDILAQERTLLGPTETYGELHDRLAGRGAELVADAIRRLSEGRLDRIPQRLAGVPDEDIQATLTRPLGKEDMQLDWSWPAARIVNTVRAFAPVPGARAVFEGDPVKIGAARLADEDESGLTRDAGFVKPAGDGRGVVIMRLTPPNRKAMSGAAYVTMRAAV